MCLSRLQQQPSKHNAATALDVRNEKCATWYVHECVLHAEDLRSYHSTRCSEGLAEVASSVSARATYLFERYDVTRRGFLTARRLTLLSSYHNANTGAQQARGRTRRFSSDLRQRAQVSTHILTYLRHHADLAAYLLSPARSSWSPARFLRCASHRRRPAERRGRARAAVGLEKSKNTSTSEVAATRTWRRVRTFSVVRIFD